MRVAVAMIPTVRELLRNDPNKLDALLEEIHDEDLADLLRLLDGDEAMKLLEQLHADDAADIFERLDERDQAKMVEHFGARRLAPIVSEMAPDDRTDLLEALPDSVTGHLLEEMDPDAAAEVEQLIHWPDDTAGGLMTTDLLRIAPEATVSETFARIRQQGEQAETIYYVYIVGASEELQGVASLRDLIMADGDECLRDIMNDHVHNVLPDMDQAEVAQLLRKYDFTAMPVCDEKGKLIGLITIDDVMDVVQEEQDEDMQRLGAVEPIVEEYLQTTFWTFFQKRAPWLFVLFIGQFLTESVLRHYDPVLRAVAQLTYYLPLLISTGGNSGSQSASLIIRALATGDLHVSDWWRVLGRELSQGLALGIPLALLGVFRVLLLGDTNGVAMTVGLTVVSVVVVGCTVGAMLPLLLQRLGLDPATSSTPFIATLIDVFGILIYFLIAQAILAPLLAAAS